MKLKYKYLFLMLLFSYCSPSKPDLESKEQWKKEIIQAEHDFARMAIEQSIPEAFIHFAAEDAVLERNDVLIEGRHSIIELFEKSTANAQQTTLTWKPDFVDVSASGDLAYTYGKYQYITIDSLGNETKKEGIFHTVWKRQQDGSWKYVWD